MREDNAGLTHLVKASYQIQAARHVRGRLVGEEGHAVECAGRAMIAFAAGLRFFWIAGGVRSLQRLQHRPRTPLRSTRPRMQTCGARDATTAERTIEPGTQFETQKDQLLTTAIREPPGTQPRLNGTCSNCVTERSTVHAFAKRGTRYPTLSWQQIAARSSFERRRSQ